jgi:phosphoglycerol transferase MdoB-like AlkP superfamily enzyme
MRDNKSSNGIGFTSLLLLAFIVLKLTHYIDWSWWWVLSPVWVPLALAGIFAAIYFLCVGMKQSLTERRIKELAAKHGPAVKSKWQERLEQMQEQQKAKKQYGK